MENYQLFDRNTEALIYGYQQAAIQREQRRAILIRTADQVRIIGIDAVCMRDAQRLL